MTSHATAPATKDHADSVAKPKVMRRPAQFNVPKELPLIAPATVVRLETSFEDVKQSPKSRPWQHDSRFALALLIVVMLANLVAYYTLQATLPPHSAHTPHATVTQNAAADSDTVNILDDSRSVAITEQ